MSPLYIIMVVYSTSHKLTGNTHGSGSFMVRVHLTFCLMHGLVRREKSMQCTHPHSRIDTTSTIQELVLAMATPIGDQLMTCIIRRNDGSTEGADPRELSLSALAEAGHVKRPLLKVHS